MNDLRQPAKVRPAEPGDAPRLASLDRLVNPSPWSESQFAASCSAGTAGSEHALVIDRAGQLQGFVVFSRVLDEACIHTIAVAPGVRRMGLAQALLHSALARACAEGAVRCHLEVRASNLAARGLYERFAFQLDGVRRNYYPAADDDRLREDALLLSRPLTDYQ